MCRDAEVLDLDHVQRFQSLTDDMDNANSQNTWGKIMKTIRNCTKENWRYPF